MPGPQVQNPNPVQDAKGPEFLGAVFRLWKFKVILPGERAIWIHTLTTASDVLQEMLKVVKGLHEIVWAPFPTAPRAHLHTVHAQIPPTQRNSIHMNEYHNRLPKQPTTYPGNPLRKTHSKTTEFPPWQSFHQTFANCQTNFKTTIQSKHTKLGVRGRTGIEHKYPGLSIFLQISVFLWDKRHYNMYHVSTH